MTMKTDDELMQELAVAGARMRLAQLERERDELLVMFPDLAGRTRSAGHFRQRASRRVPVSA
jgi:hypothetical protein